MEERKKRFVDWISINGIRWIRISGSPDGMDPVPCCSSFATVPYRLPLSFHHRAFVDSGGRRESHILWQRRPFCCEMEEEATSSPSLPRFDSDLPICVLNYLRARLIKESPLARASFSLLLRRQDIGFFFQPCWFAYAIYRTRRSSDRLLAKAATAAEFCFASFLFFIIGFLFHKVSFDFQRIRYDWRVHPEGIYSNVVIWLLQFVFNRWRPLTCWTVGR